MNPTDLCYTPATKLIPLIRSKKLSPVELTRAVLERIEKLNPKLNAFCLVTAEAASAPPRSPRPVENASWVASSMMRPSDRFRVPVARMRAP